MDFELWKLLEHIFENFLYGCFVVGTLVFVFGMSYSLGAENNTILELFSYYHQLKEWRQKFKRRLQSSVVFRRSISYNEGVPVRRLKRNGSSVSSGIVAGDEKPRCVSMVELSDKRYNVDIQLSPGVKRTGKNLKRSKSLKERISQRAGNSRTFSYMVVSSWILTSWLIDDSEVPLMLNYEEAAMISYVHTTSYLPDIWIVSCKFCSVCHEKNGKSLQEKSSFPCALLFFINTYLTV